MTYKNSAELEILKEYIKKDSNLSYDSVIKYFESKHYGNHIKKFENCILINENLLYTRSDDYVIFSDEKILQLIDLKDKKTYCTTKGYYDKESKFEFNFFIENKNESYEFDYQNNKILLNLENKKIFLDAYKLISIEERKNKTRYDTTKKERMDYFKLNFINVNEKDIQIKFENKNLIIQINDFCKIYFSDKNIKLKSEGDVFYSMAKEIREIANKDDNHVIDTNKIKGILLGEKEFTNIDILLEIKNLTDLARVMFDSNVKKIEGFVDDIIELLPLKKKVESFIKNNPILFEELDEEKINLKNHLFANLANKGLDSDLTFNNNGTYTPEIITNSVFKDMFEEVKELSKMLNMEYNIKIKSQKKALLNIQDK